MLHTSLFFFHRKADGNYLCLSELFCNKYILGIVPGNVKLIIIGLVTNEFQV